jgi:hypothetical protein
MLTPLSGQFERQCSLSRRFAAPVTPRKRLRELDSRPVLFFVSFLPPQRIASPVEKPGGERQMTPDMLIAFIGYTFVFSQ